MIQQIFGVANRSCEMLWYKWESLIPDTTANKKLNAAANKVVNVDKKRDTAANKELNAAADKAINADKEWDAAVGK